MHYDFLTEGSYTILMDATALWCPSLAYTACPSTAVGVCLRLLVTQETIRLNFCSQNSITIPPTLHNSGND